MILRDFIKKNKYHYKVQLIKWSYWEFPGRPVVRTQCFHCQSPGSIPGRGTKIQQTAWEFGTDMYTLLHLKQITNKDLLYNTGNAAQYSVVT